MQHLHRLLIAVWILCLPAEGQSVLYRFGGPAAYAYAGSAAAPAGDFDQDGWPDVLIGAPTALTAGLMTGRVEVRSGRDGSMIRVFVGPSHNEYIGTSVACAGDVDADGHLDIITGGRSASLDGICARVYSGATGVRIHEFLGQHDEGFGVSVAGLGDVDHDGHDDLLIGGPGFILNGQDVGRAVVLSGATGQQLRAIFGPTSQGYFGYAVANSGDVDLDGTNDIIVGALNSDINGFDSGSAFVYSGATGALLHSLHGTTNQAHFGCSVAAAGDVDSDGHSDVIVGAYADSTVGPRFGAARVFSGATGAQLIVLGGTVSDARFGGSVAGAGDVDADGHADLIVGASSFGYGPFVHGGIAKVFSGADGSTLYILSGDSNHAAFGWVVAQAGDVNCDGFDDVIVGARTDDFPDTDSGSVSVVLSHCPRPRTYCDGRTTALGCTPQIGASGVASLTTGNGLRVAVTSLPNRRDGVIFWGLRADHQPFAGGALCVGSPTVRSGVQNSSGSQLPIRDCSGSHSFTFDRAYLAGVIGAGTVMYVQYLGRDPTVAPADEYILSSGLAFVICP
ncbi:MAG: VCBS repeat-containing protein [Planctomycetes bacterium]|nr:VCBS repeat-containing protein [Planctomycetota bacterium]